MHTPALDSDACDPPARAWLRTRLLSRRASRWAGRVSIASLAAFGLATCSAPPEPVPTSSGVLITGVERIRPRALETSAGWENEPPQVEVRGRLLLDRLPDDLRPVGAGADGEYEPPRVCIARFPDSPLQSTGPVGRGWLRQGDSELGVFFGHPERFLVELDLETDGRFRTRFPAALLEAEPGQLSRFEMVFGRAGESEGVPELEPFGEVRAMLELRGESQLPDLIRVINAVGRPLPGHHDPVALAVAVNRLRDEGKSGALEALRSYVERTEQLGQASIWWRQDEDPSDLDVAVVLPIVHLLFEPGSAATAFPEYGFSELRPRPVDDALYPLRLIDGLPYLLGEWSGPQGRRLEDIDPEPFLEWAERYGRIRSRPLTPGNQPLSTLEELELDRDLRRANRLRLQVLYGFGSYVGLEVRSALAAEVGLLQAPQEQGLAFRFLWTRLAERLRRDALEWSFRGQTYEYLEASED